MATPRNRLKGAGASYLGVGVAFLAIAAVMMLWLKESRAIRDVDDVSAMPMAGH